MRALVIFAIFATHSVASADWKFSRKYNNSEIYKSEKDTRLILEFKKTKIENLHFTNEMVREMNNQKQRMLGEIGITDFKVDSSNVKKQNRVTKILIEGSYVDSSGLKNYFVEHHFYAPFKRLQILLTNSEENSLKKDSKLSNIQQFVDKYGI